MDTDLTDDERRAARSQFSEMTLPHGINGEDFREMMCDLMEASAAIAKAMMMMHGTDKRTVQAKHFAHVERVAVAFGNRLARNMTPTE